MFELVFDIILFICFFGFGMCLVCLGLLYLIFELWVLYFGMFVGICLVDCDFLEVCVELWLMLIVNLVFLFVLLKFVNFLVFILLNVWCLFCIFLVFLGWKVVRLGWWCGIVLDVRWGGFLEERGLIFGCEG